MTKYQIQLLILSALLLTLYLILPDVELNFAKLITALGSAMALMHALADFFGSDLQQCCDKSEEHNAARLHETNNTTNPDL